MNTLCKGQIRGVEKGATTSQVTFIADLFGGLPKRTKKGGSMPLAFSALCLQQNPLKSIAVLLL